MAMRKSIWGMPPSAQGSVMELAVSLPPKTRQRLQAGHPRGFHSDHVPGRSELGRGVLQRRFDAGGIDGVSGLGWPCSGEHTERSRGS
jgi:hypothetical protein